MEVKDAGFDGGCVRCVLHRRFDIAASLVHGFLDPGGMDAAVVDQGGKRLPGDLSPSARYWTQDVVAPEWTMDAHGMVRVPLDAPGLGIAVDDARIRALSVRTEELRA